MIYVLLGVGLALAPRLMLRDSLGVVRAYLSRYKGQHRAGPCERPMKSWQPTRPIKVIRL